MHTPNVQFQPQGPVRKVVPSHRSVTGSVPLFGKYESTLERDLMEILRFDPNVEKFTPQPATIEYVDVSGKTRKYTPDGLVVFKETFSLHIQPILFEVKYREDFRKDWRNLIRKFRAARSFSVMQGWRFVVFTEREIRTPYLANVKFLWQYLQRPVEQSVITHVLNILNDLGEADPELLLCALCSDAVNRAQFIPVIWYLVAVGLIDCDLNQPLTMHTVIRTLGVD